MIPAALFAILATSRLGAVHTVVFGGFAPASLAQRIDASKPRAVMTASCGIEGAKGPMDYKPFIEGALEKSSHKPEKVIIWEREQLKWESFREEEGERNWQSLVKSAKDRGLKAEAVPVKSGDGIYIIYTSGKQSFMICECKKPLPRCMLRHCMRTSISRLHCFNRSGVFCCSRTHAH